jgi:hypothetical protein
MGLKNKIYRVHAALMIASIVPLTILSFSGPLNADSLQVVENDIISPASLPQKQTMRQIAFLTLTIEGRIVGGMAVYDDAVTKRRGDYAEIYNPTGDLLAVIWFDRFGILRSAVDRGIVLNKHNVEGVLVLVLEGDLA